MALSSAGGASLRFKATSGHGFLPSISAQNTKEVWPHLIAEWLYRNFDDLKRFDMYLALNQETWRIMADIDLRNTLRG